MPPELNIQCQEYLIANPIVRTNSKT